MNPTVTSWLGAAALGLAAWPACALQFDPHGDPVPFVHLCHDHRATPAEIADTIAAARANGYRPEDALRARPVERIGRTAAQPNGVEPGFGYTISWSFLRDGFVLPPTSAAPGSEASSLYQTMNAQHPGGFAQWQAKFAEAFARWGAVTGNRYVYEPEDDGAPLSAVGLAGRRGDVRIGMRVIPGTVIAYNYYPSSGSDMVLDRDRNWADDEFFYNIVLHEHGHGLGLAHACPADRTKLMEPTANRLPHPTLDDILGAQSLYGDVLNHATASTVAYREARQVIAGALPQRGDEYLLPRAGLLAIGAMPVGKSYLEGPQVNDACTPGTPIDTRAFGNLAIQVFDAAGNDLAQRDAQPAGGQERMSVRIRPEYLPARVRVVNTGSNYQMYQLVAGPIPIARTVVRAAAIFADGFE